MIRLPVAGKSEAIDILAFGSSGTQEIITLDRDDPADPICGAMPPGLFPQANANENGSIKVNGFDISYPLELSSSGVITLNSVKIELN